MTEVGTAGRTRVAKQQPPPPPPVKAKEKEPQTHTQNPAERRNDVGQQGKREAHRGTEAQRRTQVGETPSSSSRSPKWQIPNPDERSRIQQRTRERETESAGETARNPSVERGRMQHNAREGIPPTTKPDFRSHQSEFQDRASLGAGETGRMRIRTKGDITLHRNNATAGFDGNPVKVTWTALGPDGRTQANMDPNGSTRYTGGHMRPGSHTEKLSPPYHNPHGWIATVTVQRNPNKVNKQSVGVSHDVTGS